MSTTDHTPRFIVLLGALAALASCNVSTPAHSADRAPIVHGPTESFVVIHSAPVAPVPKATPTTSGLSPLTFDSPALPPSTYLHPAYPEVRPYAAPSATTRTTGTVSTPHGVLRFDSTSKH